MKQEKNIFLGNWDGEICEDVYLCDKQPVIMAGPCMLETRELGLKVGKFLQTKCKESNLPYVFKTSYDKANRTSAKSVRGPGIQQGLTWLREIKEELKVPILLDVHTPEQALQVADIADVIQIPAFLFQQRDLLMAAASTGKTVQVKKGQWASADEMIEVGRFLIETCHNPKAILVERGTSFGYNNLSVDFRNLIEMKKNGNAVVFDATHSVQLPGAGDGKSSGLRNMVPSLIKAALGIGVHGLFMEVHENPDDALSDADTQISMDLAHEILTDMHRCLRIRGGYFAHDINNSMMLILNYAQYMQTLIKNDEADKQTMLEIFQKMEESIDKVNKIVNSQGRF